MRTTYVFRDQGGVIPGIPNPTSSDGMFAAGLAVDVDLSERKVLQIRLLQPSNLPSDPAAKKVGEEV